MAFEIFRKGNRTGLKLEDNEVSIGKTSISISPKLFNGYNFVEVYLNREGNQVGLRPSNDSFLGFKLNNKKNNYCNTLSGGFVKEFTPGRYQLYSDGDMMVFDMELKKTE